MAVHHGVAEFVGQSSTRLIEHIGRHDSGTRTHESPHVLRAHSSRRTRDDGDRPVQ
jgi:hypothetical protein